MTVALLCILMIIKKVAFAADTCCYGPRCPAATFVDTSGDLYGFTFTDGQEITSGSATEQALAISVSSCCPDGGNVYAHWNGDTSVENMCRCGTETTWITQSSCINSFGYQGCAPTSSPTAEQCPDISPYQVTGNSYSQNGIAYCNIGTDFNIPPTISSEQRCDIGLYIYIYMYIYGWILFGQRNS